MYYPSRLSQSDIDWVSQFFDKYKDYSLADFTQRYNCTLAEVAKILGLSPSTVRGYSSGQRKPSQAVCLQLAIADLIIRNKRNQRESKSKA